MSNNKPFRGRAIYQPSGAAGEYSQWACNIFNGCTNRCDYCYNRHSMTAKVLGADEVTMKKSLTHEIKEDPHGFFVRDWHDIVREEIDQNREAIIRDGGLFMSFVSDPLLPQTYDATFDVIDDLCMIQDEEIFFPVAKDYIPVTILTKSAWWMNTFKVSGAKYVQEMLVKHKDHLSLGFTLTGMEYMERHCISNTQERIEAMDWAMTNGIHTWASIEPVIDFGAALQVIYQATPYCSEFRIGLASKLGIKYDNQEVSNFCHNVLKIVQRQEELYGRKIKIIWKKSVLDRIK